MFCPQCGLESQADLKYCRSCGANLKVIGKAVTLSEAIARSDGVPAKIREMVQSLKAEKVTEEVSRAMDKMNTEIARSSIEQRRERRERRRQRKEKTADERRERHLTKGAIKFFTGGGLTIFLYVLFHSIQLRLPPDVVAATPFAIDPVVRSLWAFGFLPMLSGVGHIIAGLSIKPSRAREIESPEEQPLRIDSPLPELNIAAASAPFTSVTERTTNILDREPVRRSAE